MELLTRDWWLPSPSEAVRDLVMGTDLESMAQAKPAQSGHPLVLVCVSPASDAGPELGTGKTLVGSSWEEVWQVTHECDYGQ